MKFDKKISWAFIKSIRHDANEILMKGIPMRSIPQDKFLFGLEGERWVDSVKCLAIPSGTGDTVILVQKAPKGYSVITAYEWVHCEEEMSAIAVVFDMQQRGTVGHDLPKGEALDAPYKISPF